MVDAITALRVTETARLDEESIRALGCQMGPHAAEEMICRALEDLARRLRQCDSAFRTRDLDGLWRASRALGAVAGQIGMVGLVRVAGDVRLCIEDGDPVALAATTARLIRVGEASLTSIWDIHVPNI